MQKLFSHLNAAQQKTADAIIATVQELAVLDKVEAFIYQEPGFRSGIRMAIEVRPDLVLHYQIERNGQVSNSLKQNPTEGIGGHLPLSYHL